MNRCKGVRRCESLRGGSLLPAGVLLTVLLAAAPAAATDYYVAPGGNDTTNPGTIGQPWRTIQNA